jgi:CheY-like chemotaxis protein
MVKAMVVDDNRESADAVCKMLGFLGVEAQPAYGPRAAILTLQSLVPDIIFLDINMPGINGYEVMAYLRRYPEMAGVPVAFITSDDQPETAKKVRATGALLVIIKPATVDALELTLRKAGLF